MSDAPINLNKARKAKARAAARKTADRNSVAFGRTKAEREWAMSEQQVSRARLDAHRMTRDDPDQ